MKRYHIGLIRVLTTQDEKLLRLHGALIEEKFSFDVESRCIPDQYEGIHSDKTYLQAVPKIIALAQEFEREGKDGIIISCAADPGILETRNLLKIPVVGAGSAAAALALTYGTKIGILNITNTTPAAIKDILGSKLLMEIKGKASTTLELMAPNGLTDTINTSMKFKDAGIHAIILACTGMSTIQAAQKIQAITGIFTIDPVIAQGIAMWNILNIMRGDV